jgi:hypothetical protein
MKALLDQLHAASGCSAPFDGTSTDPSTVEVA